MEYLRSRIAGGTYFFTVVTHLRRKIFNDPAAVESLREAFISVRNSHPFAIDAIVVLPDHLHCIWTLPEGCGDFSTRWRLVKTEFSRGYKTRETETSGASRKSKGERGIWQRRFWEHLLRDEGDFARHVNYIHYNPVKHGLVKSPKDWPHSSFPRYVREGILEEGWGGGLSFPDGMAGE